MKFDELNTPLDLTYFIEFGDGDVDFLKEMVEIFQNDANEMLTEFDVAIETKNLTGLKKIAHKFKSVVKVFNLSESYEFVYAVEAETIKIGSADFDEAYDVFRKQISNSVASCQDLMKQLS